MFNLNIIVAVLTFLGCVSAKRPKRGLPYNNPPKYIHNWNGWGSQVNWAYNWDSYMDPGFPRYIEYIPMLWSDAPEHTDGWYVLSLLVSFYSQNKNKRLMTSSLGSKMPMTRYPVVPVISFLSTSRMHAVLDNPACLLKMPPTPSVPT